MAQFDLKKANMYIVDGYSGPTVTGQINNVAGYSPGATVIAVDTFTGAVNNGDRFTIAGESPSTVHTVTAHSETTGNTTSITFTPALAGAIVDNAALTIKAHKLYVRIGEGTLTYDEKRNIKYVTDRGKLDTTREGDEEPIDVKMDFTWIYISADAALEVTPSITEALKGNGLAGTLGWKSSDTADPCAPYAVHVHIEYSPPCTQEKKELIVLSNFRYESLGFDAKQGQVSVSGKCNVKEATVSRVTSFTS